LLTHLRRQQLAIARTSALLAAQKEPKQAPPKKVRGKKKNAAVETADEE
jgi:large subunit ribosomal protein L28e